MRNGSFNFYIEPIMASNDVTHGIFVEIYHNNRFHSIDKEICDLFNITLDNYYERLRDVFKGSFKINEQIYYDRIKGNKLERLKTDNTFNNQYFDDLKEKFKETFCEELILLNLQ